MQKNQWEIYNSGTPLPGILVDQLLLKHQKEIYNQALIDLNPLIKHNWCWSINKKYIIRHWAMLKPTIRLPCWAIFDPCDSTGSQYLSVNNIPHPFTVQQPRLKEQVGQLKLVFYIMVFLVRVSNVQTQFEEGAICGWFLGTDLKFGEKKGWKERNATLLSSRRLSALFKGEVRLIFIAPLPYN